MTGMLASVSDLNEALQVLAMDVDIIDLKQPSRGALGALDKGLVKTIVTAIDGQCTISATIGDLPMQPDIIAEAVKGMAATGVDYIKIGFFPGKDWPDALIELSELTRTGLSLIAVLFADTQPDLNYIAAIKSAGFRGVMLDTMDKQKGSLIQVMSQSDIGKFVELANRYQLLCGLAGSLRYEDIAKLIAFNPHYLGLRGALCQYGERTAPLDRKAVSQLKTALRKYAANPI